MSRKAKELSAGVACFGLWLTFGLWAPIIHLPRVIWLPLAVVLVFVGIGCIFEAFEDKDDRKDQ